MNGSFDQGEGSWVQQLQDADRALSSAILKRAQSRYDFAEARSRETGDVDEIAWAELQRAGEMYLEARFEYEAIRAGLRVDPRVFEYPEVETKFSPGPSAPKSSSR